jgi:hypothetical protein
VGRERLRAEDDRISFRLDPFRGRLQQSVCRFLIVVAIERAKPADTCFPVIVVAMIDECSDCANRLAAAPRDEIIAFHIFPRGVLLF